MLNGGLNAGEDNCQATERLSSRFKICLSNVIENILQTGKSKNSITSDSNCIRTFGLLDSLADHLKGRTFTDTPRRSRASILAAEFSTSLISY